MIDLQDKEQRGRLLAAIKHSRETMEDFRKVRVELLQDYVGSWYSKKGARYKTPINLLNQTAKIFSTIVAANNPRVLASTRNPENWAFAKRFEVNLNKLISDMNLAPTNQLIALDAFFGIGAAVVTMRDSGTRFHGLLESEEDVWFDPGEPWLNRISPDDLILDMSAKEITKMRYCGHYYRADLGKLKQESGYNQEVVGKLSPTKRMTADGVKAAREISSDAEDDDLKPMTWLANVWVAENKTVATFARDQDLPPLIERPWTGGQSGPYHFLSLGLVSDNIMPSSPASNLKGLHDGQNRVYRKIERQSDNQRTINCYSPHADDEAKKARDLKDGDWLKSRNPREIVQLKLGGIDPGNQAWSMMLQDVYNRMAGNPAARAGLGPQAPTARQEAILQEGIGQQDSVLYSAVVNFVSECCTDLARLMWHDETLRIQGSMPIPGTRFSVPTPWPVEDEWGNRVLQGSFEDLEISIQADSIRYKSAEEQLEEIMGTVRELIPLWPMFQAAGYIIDVEELLDAVARYRDRPEIRRIIRLVDEPLPAASHEASQSPVTRRETIRRNVPTGGTQESRGAMLAQILGSSAVGNNSQLGALTQS